MVHEARISTAPSSANIFDETRKAPAQSLQYCQSLYANTLSGDLNSSHSPGEFTDIYPKRIPFHFHFQIIRYVGHSSFFTRQVAKKSAFKTPLSPHLDFISTSPGVSICLQVIVQSSLQSVDATIHTSAASHFTSALLRLSPLDLAFDFRLLLRQAVTRAFTSIQSQNLLASTFL